ncbi:MULTISPECIES: cytochrome d ubiquinol oxidase subunit II [Micrococcaceae]|uniref:Cytochrome d ubiquinol oxidase subunit II n=1 Tax=Arthrobacter rhombi TaxID=71253 RepID=A0A1R4GNP9_9MICC|nr:MULTISPECIES: cytochrome d ubiquinol oxidase subunit II [Micrococcaceae]PCC26244.1 cytochrome d ubiquinol oxidase subunit II [Glutamicibacter sp. BW78]SJM69811.1 Cytochrome d ubiquinol oxidase subunit II [Arthrobacter rhombi]
MEFLPTLWFVIIAVFWAGYLFLEGFDLGVGMLMKLLARDERQRRVLLNTVGPVWDGNEVWLITAGAATFAAFPMWYASLFSALYVPLVLVLVALIFRAVAFEYRGKAHRQSSRNAWDWAISLGSFTAAFGVGAMLALTTTGLPLDANGDRVGGAFAWLTGYAVLGGLAVVAFSLIHALAFVGLKTEGELRERARSLIGRWLPVALAPMALWAILVVVPTGKVIPLVLVVLAVVGGLAGWLANRRGAEGWSFAYSGAFLMAGVSAIFVAVFPVVLPSTIDAAFNLTVANASSSEYTLGLMSVIAAFGIPLVLLYQGWSYWVFRQRVSESHIPAAHTVTPVV